MSVKLDTPIKWNTPGSQNNMQGLNTACYRHKRYQACICSAQTMHKAEQSEIVIEKPEKIPEERTRAKFSKFQTEMRTDLECER